MVRLSRTQAKQRHDWLLSSFEERIANVRGSIDTIVRDDTRHARPAHANVG